jgi:hypothetical protein
MPLQVGVNECLLVEVADGQKWPTPLQTCNLHSLLLILPTSPEELSRQRPRVRLHGRRRSAESALTARDTNTQRAENGSADEAIVLRSSNALVLEDPGNHPTILGLTLRGCVRGYLRARAHCTRSKHIRQGNIALLFQKLENMICAFHAQPLVQCGTAHLSELNFGGFILWSPDLYLKILFWLEFA